jgi:hypothetical protein
LFAEIDYFGYLIVTNKIKDKVVLVYYRDKLTEVIIRALGTYLSALETRDVEPEELKSERKTREQQFLVEHYPLILRLYEKWKIVESRKHQEMN